MPILEHISDRALSQSALVDILGLFQLIRHIEKSKPSMIEDAERPEQAKWQNPGGSRSSELEERMQLNLLF